MAMRSAAELATIAEKVHLICKSNKELSSLIGEKLIEAGNVNVLEGHDVIEVKGDDFARSVLVKDSAGKTSEITADAVFIEMALIPNSQMVADLVDLDDQGFAGGGAFDNSEIITWDADVLVPAALEDAINKNNAAEVRASIIVEGANAPTTPEADEILNEKGVLIIPDILANAGGVTVSYFEWAQNIQQFRWDEDRVNAELDKKMSRAYDSVREVASEFDIDRRTAAFVLAIRRVGKAALARIHLETELPF